jgi:general secretion pathway protein E
MQSFADPQEAADGLAALLIARRKLTAQGHERARRLSQESGERLDAILTKLGLVSERDLADALATHLDLALLASDGFPVAPVEIAGINASFLKRARILPIAVEGEALVIVMADPTDDASVRALELLVRKPVVRQVGVPADIDRAFERLYPPEPGATPAEAARDAPGDTTVGDDAERLKDLASEAPVIRLVNQLITRAVETRASDIHVEPLESRLRVRYRIDGVLREVEEPPRGLQAAIISRIKVMANLDIAERRLAQDGRIRWAIRGREIDFRVSTVPAVHGESVVLRILDQGSLKLDFAALGFEAVALERYRAILAQPHGILLVTGPTGSGKTTTLYASLLTLNTADKKILTVEDPIEYLLEGINQVQVKPQIGWSFATALRSFLRQDPDIMMVGEIRDLETAQIAVQAALTGHLVLSTVHTNDAASAVTRLLDMGVEDYLMTSTINGLVGQRLVRVLCPSCREPYAALPGVVERLGLDRFAAEKGAPVTLWKPVGCAACNHTGYLGRTMVIEVLPVSDAIRGLILQHAEAREIQRVAIGEGMVTMFQHGMQKALAGITTPEEVLRVTRDV